MGPELAGLSIKLEVGPGPGEPLVAHLVENGREIDLWLIKCISRVPPLLVSRKVTTFPSSLFMTVSCSLVMLPEPFLYWYQSGGIGTAE